MSKINFNDYYLVNEDVCLLSNPSFYVDGGTNDSYFLDSTDVGNFNSVLQIGNTHAERVYFKTRKSWQGYWYLEVSGSNYGGQCGLGYTYEEFKKSNGSPVGTIRSPKKIVVGECCVCCLQEDGKLYQWGTYDGGPIANQKVENTSPVLIAENVKDFYLSYYDPYRGTVYRGGRHSIYIIKNDNSLWVTGRFVTCPYHSKDGDDIYRLGRDIIFDPPFTFYEFEQNVEKVLGAVDYREPSACYIKKINGKVLVSGDNNFFLTGVKEERFIPNFEPLEINVKDAGFIYNQYPIFLTSDGNMIKYKTMNPLTFEVVAPRS